MLVVGSVRSCRGSKSVSLLVGREAQERQLQ